MKDRCREIIKSKLFIILQLALACCVTTLRLEVAGTVAFCCVLSFIFLFSDDVFDTTLPFMLLCLTLIKCFDSFNVFIWLVPVGVLTFAAFLLFIRRNFRLRKSWTDILTICGMRCKTQRETSYNTLKTIQRC